MTWIIVAHLCWICLDQMYYPIGTCPKDSDIYCPVLPWAVPCTHSEAKKQLNLSQNQHHYFPWYERSGTIHLHQASCTSQHSSAVLPCGC